GERFADASLAKCHQNHALSGVYPGSRKIVSSSARCGARAKRPKSELMADAQKKSPQKLKAAAAKAAGAKTSLWDSDLFGSNEAPPAAAGGYTAKDIEVLEGLEPVRRRPGMYIGGVDERALH